MRKKEYYVTANFYTEVLLCMKVSVGEEFVHVFNAVVSGEITTLVTLDFELQNTYFLRVRAIDMGVPSLSST